MERVTRVVSIDIGVVNLGFICAEIEWSSAEPSAKPSAEPSAEPSAKPVSNRPPPVTFTLAVKKAVCVDLTRMPHNRVKRGACTLYHSRAMTDRVDHFVQEYADVLDSADVVLIERQPLTGLTCVQELLHKAYRSKAVICSPNTLHAWMGINDRDYEARKEATVARARPYLEGFDDFDHNDRKHDMADALCFALWYAEQSANQSDEANLRAFRDARLAKIRVNNLSVNDFFNQFAYRSNVPTPTALPTAT